VCVDAVQDRHVGHVAGHDALDREHGRELSQSRGPL
jgi:hypothetical protein